MNDTLTSDPLWIDTCDARPMNGMRVLLKTCRAGQPPFPQNVRVGYFDKLALEWVDSSGVPLRKRGEYATHYMPLPEI